MKRFSHLTRITILLVVFFAIDKIFAIFRQLIIGRVFGLSKELDAFNAANNIPDLLFALISGGALAIAFIPVLSEVLTKQGRGRAWVLFSQIANLAFVTTAILAVVVGLMAEQLVGWRLGVAPGFGEQEQHLVANLMRLNLIATLIFSISGLVMAGLQANQHFLLPAIAPILYNIGQIFGAVVLAPEHGITIGPVQLPAFDMGVHGLVYGVILGAVLHLAIQIPGLVKYQFRWTGQLGLRTPEVWQVLKLLGPRLLTMFFIQITFIARDNMGSYLGQGAVSALTYGWMLMQVPETLIGTAIGTAMLPTLAEYLARNEREAFRSTVERAARVLTALTLPIAAILAFSIKPFVQLGFDFDAAGTELVTLATMAYLAGLTGHSLLELAARTFYAQQKALIPFIAAAINTVLFILLGVVLMGPLGAPGIALANSLAFTSEAILLFFWLNRYLPAKLQIGNTMRRAVVSAIMGGLVVFGVMRTSFVAPIITAGAAIGAGIILAVPLVWKEIRMLARL